MGPNADAGTLRPQGRARQRPGSSLTPSARVEQERRDSKLTLCSIVQAAQEFGAMAGTDPTPGCEHQGGPNPSLLAAQAGRAAQERHRPQPSQTPSRTSSLARPQ
jgi:hypothetical protein